nr:hypothetical protein [Paramyrothecium roridum]
MLSKLLPFVSCALALSGIANCGAPPYRDRLLTLHKDLIDIPSISRNETEIGEFLINYLEEHGFTTERQPLPSAETRFNVLAWPAGRQPNITSKVILTSHMDVVPPYIAYSQSGPDPPTAETVLSGRGAVDDKGGLAAQIVAAEELIADGSVAADDFMLLFVVGEEILGDGMLHYSSVLASGARPDLLPEAVVFAEPTEGKLACGHKGALGCTITARGESAHSGYPWLGKSATEVLMRALVLTLDTDLGSSELFGNTTVNVGQIEGGVALNVVADRATARLGIRVAIGPELEGAAVVKQRLVDLMNSVDPEAFEYDCLEGYGPVETDCDVEGFETVVVNYGTDIPNFKANVTRYLYGPGSITVAHRPDEALTLGELEESVEGYKRLVLHVAQG